MKMQLSNPLSRIFDAVTRSQHTHTTHQHSTDIDYDDTLEILANERRRYTLEYLADKPADESLSVSDIATYVAAQENDCTADELSSQQRERVYIPLIQQHLISMDGVVIEYDTDRRVVVPTETPSRLWRAYCSFQRSLTG